LNTRYRGVFIWIGIYEREILIGSKLDKKSCPSHRRTAQERQRDKPPEFRACYPVKHRYSVIEDFAARSQRV
jgi:hypothetical protein